MTEAPTPPAPQEHPLAPLLRAAADHQRNGRLADAERAYRQVLEADLHNPVALHHLGLIAHQTGHRDLAIQLLNRSIAAAPKLVRFRTNFAAALLEMGLADDAIAQFRYALELAPDDVELLAKVAAQFEAHDRLPEAYDCYRRACQSNPDDALLHVASAVALGRMGFHDEALSCLRHATALQPHNLEAHTFLGLEHAALGDVDASINALYHAVKLATSPAPDEKRQGGRRGASPVAPPQDAESDTDHTLLSHLAHQSLLHALHFHPDYEPPAIFAEHRRWARSHADPVAKTLPPPPNDRSPDRKLKLAYLCPHFNDSPTGRLIAAVIANHDRDAFDVECFTTSPMKLDDVSKKIQQYAPLRYAGDASDLALAAHLRKNNVDLVVDLTAHAPGSRAFTLALKPAPVQLTWLSAHSTTGLQTVDYRISDPVLDPPDVDTTRHYTEKTLRLPTTCYTFAPPAGAPHVNDLPADTLDAITFAALADPRHHTPAVLDTFAELLARLPDSRLLLSTSRGQSIRTRLLAHFTRRDIAPGRILFHEPLPHRPTLELYHRADIALDPFPHAAPHTALDALFMGLPVVTLTGHTPVSRATASILRATNLPHLIATTPADYVTRAAALATDIPKLSALRKSLRQQLLASPVSNPAQFTKDLESAYRTAWRTWCTTPA